MTISTFSLQTDASSEYRPGVCNIGPAEIARRRMAGHVGLIATLGLLAFLIVIGAPPVMRLLVVLPAAASASGYLQAWLKFCAGFGSRGSSTSARWVSREQSPMPRRGLWIGADRASSVCGRSRSVSSSAWSPRSCRSEPWTRTG